MCNAVSRQIAYGSRGERTLSGEWYCTHPGNFRIAFVNYRAWILSAGEKKQWLLFDWRDGGTSFYESLYSNEILDLDSEIKLMLKELGMK